MKFVSTRNQTSPVTFSESLLLGPATDGGLLIPENFPFFLNPTPDSFLEISKMIINKFAEDDELSDKTELICKEAFNFPIEIKKLKNDTAILELFHGPTCAFKDIGARFLASSISLLQSTRKENLTVIVATSGDTGSAVASAFYNKPFIDVIVLYPEGKISERQEKQLTCWGENVKAFAVRGVFDDCQKMVKQAFQDPWWKSQKHLISANSISIGRILPQTFYYAWASLEYYSKHGYQPGFIIPSGNLGNATACLWAKKMGFPIREVVMSTNQNHSVLDFEATGKFTPHLTIPTLANAMDVGNPSNIERIINLYPDHNEFKKDVQVILVNDTEIQNYIQNGEKDWGEIFCPHTATAFCAREKLKSAHWIIVATASPAKFESIIEPLIMKRLQIPKPLEEILHRPTTKTLINANLDDLKVNL